MELSETVVETSTAQATVSGTITAAANTLIIAVAGAELSEDAGNLSGPDGWTEILPAGQAPSESFRLDPTDPPTTEPFVIFGAWYVANPAAGDVAAEITWAKDTFGPEDTPDEMILHLLEISGGTFVDFVAAATNETNTDGKIPKDVKDAEIAVSREGNLGVFAGIVADVAANLTPPSGYSSTTETDATSGRWSLVTYSRPLPFATAYQAQAETSSGRNIQYAIRHFECDAPSYGALVGSDF